MHHTIVLAALFAALPLMADTGIVDIRQGSLAQLAKKASAGEEIRIVTLGGSITQQAKGHSRMIPEWFQKRFPKAKVSAFNTGLSSTCSHTGAFRFESHVLSKKPDLLVAEFAVNDDQDARHSYDDAVKGMEGIVRNAHAHNIPVVMILFVNGGLLSSQQAGKPATSVKAHLAVADHYGVPTIDVPKALANAITEKKMDWKAYGGVHPNSNGYRFVSDYAIQAIEQILVRPPRTRTNLPKPLNPASFFKGEWVDPAKATYSSHWKHGNPSKQLLPKGGIRSDYLKYPLARADDPGATVSFPFEGTAVGAFVLAGPDAGQIEVRVDGGAPKTVELYHKYSGGLNYPRTCMFADGLSAGKHLLELKILDTHHAKSKGTACALLYFAVNR